MKLDACLTSPRVRARDTAEIACKELESKSRQTDALRGGEFDIEELTAGRGEVLLVGHEPDFSRAIHAATGAQVKMKKGGLAGIEDGVLHVLLRPAELKRIGRLTSGLAGADPGRGTAVRPDLRRDRVLLRL